MFIGANDPQNFMDGSTSLTYGTAAWNAAYGQRVGAFMQTAVDSGARVLWIGMPPMADPGLNAQMENLNDIDQSQAASHRGVTYFASWPVLSNAQGHYDARSCRTRRGARSRSATSTAPTSPSPAPSACPKPPSPSWATSGDSSCRRQVPVGAAPRQGCIARARRPQPPADGAGSVRPLLSARIWRGPRSPAYPSPSWCCRLRQRRAVQTAELVVAELEPEVALLVEPALYAADADDIVEMLRALGGDAPSVLVVGHNPTVHDLVLLLLDGEDAEGRSRLDQGFPTAALAVTALSTPSWAGVAPGTATLVELRTPDR